MATGYELHEDIAGKPITAPPVSSYINNYALVANTPVSITPPGNSELALFKGTANFYVRVAGAAAVPAANVTDGTGAELNPDLRYIAGATISLVAPANCIVTIAFYETRRK